MGDPDVEYASLVSANANAIVEGRVDPDAARRQVVATASSMSVSSRVVYFLTLQHKGLARNDPLRAIAGAELNYAVAEVVGATDPLLRAYAAQALGNAWVTLARREKDPEPFRRAIEYLEPARVTLAVEDPPQAAQVSTLLGVAYLGSGDTACAVTTLTDAVERWAAVEPSREQVVAMAQAYGNLGWAQQRAGDIDAARANHLAAFDLFCDANEAGGARTALEHLARVDAHTGRSDDVLAVAERLIGVLVEQANIRGVIETQFLCATHAARTRRWEEVLRFLSGAEELLAVQVNRGDRMAPPEYVDLYMKALLWKGAMLALLAMGAAPDTMEQAYAAIAEARAFAQETRDDDSFAQATLQKARLDLERGALDDAEHEAELLSQVPAGEVYDTGRLELVGEIALKKGRYSDAIDVLVQVSDRYDDVNIDRKMVAFAKLGETYDIAGRPTDAVHALVHCLETFERARMELNEESRVEVTNNVEDVTDRLIGLLADATKPCFDPIRALDWLERTKSRALVEVLGLTPMRLVANDDASKLALDEEDRLLDRLNVLRQKLFVQVSASDDRMSLHREMQECTSALEDLWDQLASSHPEYVSMRKGRPLEWTELSALVG